MRHEITERVLSATRFEYALIILFLIVCSWAFYRLFLGKLSPERHQIFRLLFRQMATGLSLSLAVFLAHKLILPHIHTHELARQLIPYTGLLSIFMGAHLFVKTMEIIFNEYFFFNSMRAGVPLLLINVSKLILSLIILAWILTGIFHVKLSSVLATSAVLTIVLGLALQDTLGNLFAAVALQIDKPFAMDDWIEIRNGDERISGQVKELSWRATVILSITDEIITIPNKTIAMSQVVNFAAKTHPFIRGQVFRVPYGSPLDQVTEILLSAARSVPGILQTPGPLVLVTETHESWIGMKAVYSVNDYGNQYLVADKFYRLALAKLEAAGIGLASPRLKLKVEN